MNDADLDKILASIIREERAADPDLERLCRSLETSFESALSEDSLDPSFVDRVAKAALSRIRAATSEVQAPSSVAASLDEEIYVPSRKILVRGLRALVDVLTGRTAAPSVERPEWARRRYWAPESAFQPATLGEDRRKSVVVEVRSFLGAGSATVATGNAPNEFVVLLNGPSAASATLLVFGLTTKSDSVESKDRDCNERTSSGPKRGNRNLRRVAEILKIERDESGSPFVRIGNAEEDGVAMACARILLGGSSASAEVCLVVG